KLLGKKLAAVLRFFDVLLMQGVKSLSLLSCPIFGKPGHLIVTAVVEILDQEGQAVFQLCLLDIIGDKGAIQKKVCEGIDLRNGGVPMDFNNGLGLLL